jgi:hypothetical protein
MEDDTTPSQGTDNQPKGDPPRPVWTEWAPRDACRIWKAVMLYINIDPAKINWKKLKDQWPEKFKEFELRADFVTAAYGPNQYFVPTDHPRQGKLQRNRYISLPRFVEYVRERRWPGHAAFAGSMVIPDDQQDHAGTAVTTHPVADNEQDRAGPAVTTHRIGDKDKDEESKDEGNISKFQSIRMGALLRILELVQTDRLSRATHGVEPDKALSDSAVARWMQEIIEANAEANKKDKLPRFKEEANRKNLATATKRLQAFDV